MCCRATCIPTACALSCDLASVQGEISFQDTPALLPSLETAVKLADAARQGTVQRILMQNYHADAINAVDAAALGRLNRSGVDQILPELTDPQTNPSRAIPTELLAKLATEHQPITVKSSAVDVQWAVNCLGDEFPIVTAGNWLVFISNNEGVRKPTLPLLLSQRPVLLFFSTS